MSNIWIGLIYTIVGLISITYGITKELDKKMENKTGGDIKTQTVFFNNSVIKDGKPVGEIEFLIIDRSKIEVK